MGDAKSMGGSDGSGAGTARIVAVDDLEGRESAHGERYGWRRWQLGSAAGGRKLGCSLYELRPGKRHFPFHGHHANEEAIYVLEGNGTLRLADGDHPLRPGDYAAFPVGAGGVHQVRNDSDAPLRFLCLSTMIEPDIAFQPDSGKVGLFAGSAPGGPQEERTLSAFLSRDDERDYWEGEEG